MERWIAFALLSMLFAGGTAVVAKLGLAGISAELGLAVRTSFVFVLVLLFAAFIVPIADVRTLTWTNLLGLGLSAVTTAASWVFYYKAIHEGEVSTVAIIDKGSFLIALALAWLLLGEAITLRTAVGAGLVLAGLLVVAWKR
jgi:transporter family protein